MSDDEVLAGIMRAILKGERGWQYNYVLLGDGGIVIDGGVELTPDEFRVAEKIYKLRKLADA